MPWKQLQYRGRSPSNGATLSISPKGLLWLARGFRVLLGAPDHVALFYDPDTDCFAIRGGGVRASRASSACRRGRRRAA